MAKQFTIFTKFAAIDAMTGPVQKMMGKVGQLGEKADKAAKGMGSKNGIAGILGGVGKGILGAVGAITAAGTAAAALATHTADAAESINATAGSLGISTKALQEYRYIAENSAMSTDDMDTALKKLTVNLGKGGASVDATLGMLGLTAQQLRAAGPDQVLEMIADGMKNVKTPTAKAAIVTELFGKNSVKMVNVLSQGSGAIRDMRKEAESVGYVMDDVALGAGQNLNDTLDRLRTTFTGVMNRVGAKFAPFLERVANGLQKALQPGGALGKVLDGLLSAIDGLLPLFEQLGPIIGNVMQSLGPKIGEIVKAAGPALTKLLEMVSKLAPPLLELVSIVVDMLKPAFDLLAPVFDILTPILQGIIDVVKVLANVVKAVLEPVLGTITEVLNGFSAIINGKGGGAFENKTGGTAPAAAAPGSGAARWSQAPVSPLSPGMRGYRSTVDVNFNKVPTGTVIKQAGAAPGVTVNTGQNGVR